MVLNNLVFSSDASAAWAISIALVEIEIKDLNSLVLQYQYQLCGAISPCGRVFGGIYDDIGLLTSIADACSSYLLKCCL